MGRVLLSDTHGAYSRRNNDVIPAQAGGMVQGCTANGSKDEIQIRLWSYLYGSRQRKIFGEGARLALDSLSREHRKRAIEVIISRLPTTS